MGEPAARNEPVHLARPAVRPQRLSPRWILAAVLTGAVSAFAAALVRLSFMGLEWVFAQSTAPPPVAAAHLALWRRGVTPVAGALLAILVIHIRERRARRRGGEPRGYAEYVEAVRHGGGAIPFAPNCWRTLSAAFSIGSGAAVGREGSMIQFAAAAASSFGGWLRRRLGGTESLNGSLLVALGVAGGVSTAYNAPAASMFFAAEIVLGSLEWRELAVLALASASGWAISGAMLGTQRLYPASVSLHGQGWALGLLPLVAVLFGVLGPLYQKLIRSLRFAKALPLALVWGGVVVGLASMRDPRVWGNGDLGLSAALGKADLPGLSIAAPAVALLLVLRLVSTTVCVGTGTVGGVFTPTLFAGGAAGALLGHLAAHVLPLNAAIWAIAGMSFLMAAVTHAPIMAALMAVELTGNWLLLPVLLVLNVIAWRIARRFSSEALYAIASQAPVHPSPRTGGTV